MDKKAKKERSKEYDKKLAVNTTFDELLAISLGKQPQVKESPKTVQRGK